MSNFIRTHDHEFAGILSGFHNYSRVVSLAHFATLIKKLDLNRQSHTGVVSGSKDELELRFVQSDKVTIFSFENDKSFNLDQPWFDLPSQNFSLTFS